MRTYVRMMGIGPYRPIRELEGAVERGELDIALGIAKDYAREHARPIGLRPALALIGLVAATGDDYDGWACRWLARWLREARPSIGQAAEIAATLADLPSEPSEIEVLRSILPPA